MSRDPSLFLDDILEACHRIAEYTAGYDLTAFVDDRRTFDAVIRNIEIIGEATSNLPQELLALRPNLPWREIVGMRNRIAHAYFGVDVQIVWDVITTELEPLAEAVAHLRDAAERR